MHFAFKRVKETLCRVLLRRSIKDEVAYTMVGSPSKKKKWLESGEWFALDLFCTMQESLNVVRSKYVIAQFSTGLKWPENRSYINRFFWRGRKKSMSFGLLGAQRYLVYLYFNDVQVDIFSVNGLGILRGTLV